MKKFLGVFAAFLLLTGLMASPAGAARADRDGGELQIDPRLDGGPPEHNALPDSQGGGTASIVRNDAGISVSVRSTGLMPGHAYSAWFIAFDNGFGNGPPIVVNLGGNIVGASGNSTFSGHLAAGEGAFGNPRGADVFIHVVHHGPAADLAPGDIPTNIHTTTGILGFAQEWFFEG